MVANVVANGSFISSKGEEVCYIVVPVDKGKEYGIVLSKVYVKSLVPLGTPLEVIWSRKYGKAYTFPAPASASVADSVSDDSSC